MVALAVGGCCQQSTPPAITGVTISAVRPDGLADPVHMARTRLGPPIAAIAMRPGADAGGGAMLLNEPVSGSVAVTLARGQQSFILFTAGFEVPPPYVLAIFLDSEPTPAITAVLDNSDGATRPSELPEVQGMDGNPVPNRSSLRVERRGFRVSLQRAWLPALERRLDATGAWRLIPDNSADSVAVMTLDVAAAAPEQATQTIRPKP